MAQKKGGGSTRNGRDSQPKRRGVKVFGGQDVSAGAIIVRPDRERGGQGKGVDLGGRRLIHNQKRQGHRQNFTEIEIGAVRA